MDFEPISKDWLKKAPEPDFYRGWGRDTLDPKTYLGLIVVAGLCLLIMLINWLTHA